MELIEQTIMEMKQEIDKRPNKLVYMKLKTFLLRCGYRRRNKKVIRIIESLLADNDIKVYVKKERVQEWNDIPYEETITFKMEGEEKMQSQLKVPINYAGYIKISSGKNPINLYVHQDEAIRKLDSEVMNKKNNSFSGLLVIPTGGGKTLTAVQWLLRNAINHHKKVLWIAHRHELLEQAFQAVKKNSYQNLINNREGFRYRIISGMHDRPVNIQSNDDFIIASKDSLNRGINYLIEKWLMHNDEEIVVVIDEAHHATAKTYRNVINKVKENVKHVKILGLTATPFRTSENEKGLLKKLFADDIVYKIDLETLINRGILAKPIFEEMNTHLDLYKDLTDKDIKNIQAFDAIPEDIAKKIAGSKERNFQIVNHYIQNQNTYGQLLVFAIDINHAITLNALFKQKGIASDYIVSSLKDAATGVVISNEENKEKIQRFKGGHLNVLINVNILTEGTDLPNVQTVFLTRPTISAILMTQMIGRALRGTQAGGTEKAYVLSFIDNWKDKIAWINPEKLFIEESATFIDNSNESIKQLIRLISIEKMEEFAKIADDSVNTEQLEALSFLKRVPLGLYSFSILQPSENGDLIPKNCEVLIYSHMQQAYQDFITDLEVLFKEMDMLDKEYLDETELDNLCKFVKSEYFDGYEMLPNYRDQDIKDILSYYALKNSEPIFLPFTDRYKFDLSIIAQYIFDQSLGGKAKVDYIDSVWEDETNLWKVFFGYNKLFFRKQLGIELLKIEEPDIYPEPFDEATVEYDLVNIEKLSLSEMRKKHPQHWRTLSNKVFENSKNDEGFYTCALSGFKSKNKLRFQIDHIVPMSKGGLSKLDNLQILEKTVNLIKGDKLI